MLKLPLRYLAPALLLSALALAQTQPATPLVSPKSAYDDAMRPFQLTRNSIANWSDTEIAALKVTMVRAGMECALRDPKTFAGDDLSDLIRLCALGQSWPSVVQASTLYIDSKNKPHLAQAYAALIDAQLHLHNEPAAFAASQAILTAVPYDALSAEVIHEAIAYMQFNFPDDALTLATARQPLILVGLHLLANPLSPSPQTTTPAAANPPQSVHDLYADGLNLAALQQLARQAPDDIAATVTALDSALPAPLTPDDSLPITALRRSYALLGQPLPKIATTAWPNAQKFLSLPNRLPDLPAHHAITALMLFPDWCAQCVRMGANFPTTVFTVAGHEAYFYGLLAETVEPKVSKDATVTPAFTPENAAALLAETPTLAVNPSVLDQFAVTEPPFLILTDAQGIIRVLQPVTEDALAPGNTVDSAIALVGKQWPTIHPAAKAGPAAASPNSQE